MDFGLDLPSGNAYDAGKIVPDSLSYQMTLPVAKKDLRPSTNWEALTLEKFNEVKGVNVADIYPYSKSKYGHRAVAFRDQEGQWFVLDPYVKIKGFESNEPKPLEAYMKIRPIYKSHFYTSSGYEKQVA